MCLYKTEATDSNLNHKENRTKRYRDGVHVKQRNELSFGMCHEGRLQMYSLKDSMPSADDTIRLMSTVPDSI